MKYLKLFEADFDWEDDEFYLDDDDVYYMISMGYGENQFQKLLVEKVIIKSKEKSDYKSDLYQVTFDKSTVYKWINLVVLDRRVTLKDITKKAIVNSIPERWNTILKYRRFLIKATEMTEQEIIDLVNEIYELYSNNATDVLNRIMDREKESIKKMKDKEGLIIDLDDIRTKPLDWYYG